MNSSCYTCGLFAVVVVCCFALFCFCFVFVVVVVWGEGSLLSILCFVYLFVCLFDAVVFGWCCCLLTLFHPEKIISRSKLAHRHTKCRLL